MHSEQRQQTHSLLKQQRIDQALFARPESVKWLTGFAPPVQVGPNLFTASYPLVWYDKGQFTLIAVDAYADLAAPFGQEPDGQVVTYLGYTIEQPIASGKTLLAAFNTTANTSSNGKIGIEREYVGDLIAAELREQNEIVAIDGWLEPLRMIKTEEELVRLRRNFAPTDIGHAAARVAMAAGKREIDVWNALHSAIQQAAGCRVPVGNDCVVGYRQANIGGWPLDYEIRAGDSLIVDISVVLDGYWSDSCATYYAGERSARQEKLHRTALDALDFGISLIRPGVVARDIDQQVRQFIANAGFPVYPHHTGHGVGVSGHEAPRIVPYSDEVLREGMVIMLEPGIYFPGETSVRIEDAMLVTPNGAEILTFHNKA
jgi:Xaa-Pro aminopeptidase